MKATTIKALASALLFSARDGILDPRVVRSLFLDLEDGVCCPVGEDGDGDTPLVRSRVELLRALYEELDELALRTEAGREVLQEALPSAEKGGPA